MRYRPCCQPRPCSRFPCDQRCHGEPRAQVTLPTALAKVYEENPTLEAARARLRSVDEGLPIARAIAPAARLDQLERRFRATETNRGSQNLRTLRNAVGIEQPLYTGGEARARIDRAEELIRAERARLEARRAGGFPRRDRGLHPVLRDQRILDLALANESRLGTARWRAAALSLRRVDPDRCRPGRGPLRPGIARSRGGGRRGSRSPGRVSPGDRRPAGHARGCRPAGRPAAQAVDAVLAGGDDHPIVRAARFGVDAARAEIDTALSP
jgi:hypothetical protein